MPDPAPFLLFVYNADSGLFNTLADIGHKLFAPDSYPCELCALTHGYLKEKEQWRRFVEGLGIHCEFLHRDQFRNRYPDDSTPLPAVFLVRDGSPRPCLEKAALAACRNLKSLQQQVLHHCLQESGAGS